jgi:multiple sugar transport system permease protein
MKRLPEGISPYLYLLPAALIIAVFHIFPIFFSFLVSGFDWGMGGAQRFVGLGNYADLFRDAEFWQSLIQTVFYAVGVVPATIVVSLAIAALLNQKLRLLGFYRTVYFLPVVTSAVAISMVWKWIYNPRIGFLNYFLGLLHIPPLGWLEESRGILQVLLSPLGVGLSGLWGGPSIALCSVILMSIWHSLGYNIVIFLAGLQNIPPQYYEAAKIDGADALTSFRYVTWPLLSPTTFYVLIMTTIAAFRVFTQIYMMTGPPIGGPLGTTKVVVYYLYEQAFARWQMGYATAIAFAFFLIVLSLTIIQRQVVEKRVHY